MLDDVAVETILQTDNLPKSKPAYGPIKPVIGATSLVTIAGDHWKKLRKMFNPAFAPSHVETMVPYIVEESLVFIQKLKDVANTEKIVKMNDLTTVHHL
jgi:cytochrome P450